MPWHGNLDSHWHPQPPGRADLRYRGVMIKLNETFSAGERLVPLNGSCEPRFEAVLEAFVQNYRCEDEVGSAVSVVVDGRTVVDLWGGWRDAGRQREWQHDTIVCMMSVSKGITGLAFSLLVDRGLVDVDEPVAKYWPEFARNGKQTLPVRFVLDHRAGLPIIADPLWPGAIYDHAAICEALAAQAPLWEPGTVAAYHVHTQGYLLGEIVRRVTGKSVGAFVRDELAGPLAADFMIGGLSGHDQARCAEVMPNMQARLFAAKEVETDTLRARAFVQNPAEPWPVTLNSALWRESEIASGNGHGNARARRAHLWRLRPRRGAGWRAADAPLLHRSHDHRATQHHRTDAGPAVPPGARHTAEHARRRCTWARIRAPSVITASAAPSALPIPTPASASRSR